LRKIGVFQLVRKERLKHMLLCIHV